MRGFMKKHKIICIVAVLAFILILALSFIVRARLFSSKDRGSPPATQTDAVSDADSQNVIADADSDFSDTGDSDKKEEDSDSLVSVSSNLDKDDSGSSEQSNSNNDSNNSGSSGNGNTGNSGNGNTISGSGNTGNSGNSGNSGNTGSGSNSGSGTGSSVSDSGSGSNSGSGSGSGSGSNSGSGSSTTESSSVSCNHSWKKVTKTVHHDEVGHWEDVVVQDAWDESKFIKTIQICNKCGAEFDYVDDNLLMHILDCNGGSGYYSKPIYETVHHDAVTERQWVVDVPAYDEYGVFDHYECTKCGAVTKTIGVRTFLLCSISDIKRKVEMVSENR